MKLVLKEQRGLVRPGLGEYYPAAYDRKSVEALLHENSNIEWNYVATKDEWKPLDILIFTRAGGETHVGLHSPRLSCCTMEGIDSCFERYDSALWARMLRSCKAQAAKIAFTVVRVAAFFVPAGWKAGALRMPLKTIRRLITKPHPDTIAQIRHICEERPVTAPRDVLTPIASLQQCALCGSVGTLRNLPH